MMASTTTQRAGEAFAFANAPKAVPATAARKKSAAPPPAPEDAILNLMSDPRVFRGSMYSQYRTGAAAAAESGVPFSTTKARTRRLLRGKPESIFDAVAPPTLDRGIDLLPYLVERPKVVEQSEECTQCDDFVDQAPRKPFVPKKTGVDAATDMLLDQPFDFDREVSPLLEVLVGRTLQRAMLEVQREAELESISVDVADKEAEQEDERLRVLAIEAALGDARILQKEAKEVARTQAAAGRLIASKVAAARLMAQVLPHILTDAFDHFDERGAWVYPMATLLRGDVLPWLVDGVADEYAAMRLGEQLLDDLLRAAFKSAAAAVPEAVGSVEAAVDAAVEAGLAAAEAAAEAAEAAAVEAAVEAAAAPTDAVAAAPAPAAEDQLQGEAPVSDAVPVINDPPFDQ
ncbi:radial spoke protein 3-domain-containing protein [Pelagophyceae sp. CCMP2097]|nr:radial spoke protein 3-domain-containing protein [Pelagophyceae sp. CCMP2097]